MIPVPLVLLVLAAVGLYVVQGDQQPRPVAQGAGNGDTADDSTTDVTDTSYSMQAGPDDSGESETPPVPVDDSAGTAPAPVIDTAPIPDDPLLDTGAPESGTAEGYGLRVMFNFNDGFIRVRSGGSVAWRCNNPGNIRPAAWNASMRMGVETATGGKYCIFADEQTGFTALAHLIENVKVRGVLYRDMSIKDFFATYAPTGDSNNPASYAATVAREIGVDVSYIVGELSSVSRQKFMNAIQRVEGWNVGTLEQYPKVG